MKLKLIKYNLDVKYVPGKYMYVADLFSRSYIKRFSERWSAYDTIGAFS